MNSTTRYFLRVCPLLAAAALAACGGSGGSSDETSGSGDFAAQANKICADAAYEITAGSAAGSAASGNDPAAAADQANRAVAVLAQRDDDLEAVTPPTDVKSDYDAMLSALGEETDGVRKQAAAYAAGDDVSKLQVQTSAAHDSADRAAAAAGLNTCADILPPAAAQEVEANITTLTTSTPAEIERACNELTTQTYLDQVGGLANCANKPPGGSVSFTSTKGVEGVAATTLATFAGGHQDGNSFEVNLAYEDGTYKIDGVSAR